MILEFSITNFYSFKEKTTFNMLADENEAYKVTLFQGDTASGKTNAFRILGFFKLMIGNSNTFKENTKLPILPFRFDKKTRITPSEFEIKFILNNEKYIYGFKADANQIYKEYLHTVKDGEEIKIFERENIDRYSFCPEDEKKLEIMKTKNMHNQFFLTTSATLNYIKTKEIVDFIIKNFGTCFDVSHLKSFALPAYNIAQNDEKFKKRVLEILQKADETIEDYKIVKVEIPKQMIATASPNIREKLYKNPYANQIVLKHFNNDFLLNIEEESKYVQNIFILIPFILDAMDIQKVLIIDGIEDMLSQDLINCVIELFNNSFINTQKSQLMINVNNHSFINKDMLDKSQLWTIKKDKDTLESKAFLENSN